MCKDTIDERIHQLVEKKGMIADAVVDGKVSLEVIETNDTDIKCKVLVGGEISNHKGINIPNVHLDFDYLSEQDKLDLQFGVKEDVDFVAASFVRSKDDVVKLRNYLDYIGGNNIKIISKIENIEGVDNFDEILKSVGFETEQAQNIGDMSYLKIHTDGQIYPVKQSKFSQIYMNAKDKIQGMFNKIKAIVKPKTKEKENDSNER